MVANLEARGDEAAAAAVREAQAASERLTLTQIRAAAGLPVAVSDADVAAIVCGMLRAYRAMGNPSPSVRAQSTGHVAAVAQDMVARGLRSLVAETPQGHVVRVEVLAKGDG